MTLDLDGRCLLVGGLSRLHDPLCAAALRGVGIPSLTLHRPTNTGLQLARAHGHHGQCNPPHYLAGAILEQARDSGPGFTDRYAWLTVGSCGPCRLAAFALEYQRVLRGAGLGNLPIIPLDQLSFVQGDGPLPAAALRALATALVLGDVLTTLGHRWRPYAEDPEEVEALLRSAVAALSEALEQGALIEPVLRVLRESSRGLALDHSRVLPRLLMVGEPWTTLADGDPSYDLARRLELFGADVDCPKVIDWLRYRLHEEQRHLDIGRTAPSPERRRALEASDGALCEAWSHLAAQVGLPERLRDPAEMLAAAAPHYPEDVCGGSGALEVGRALCAVRDGRVDLVVSIKPFGCLPSSAISDGILSVLLRARGVRFLVIETTGSADANIESRLEMALHSATLAALDESARRSAASTGANA